MTERETASVQGEGCRVCGGRGWHTAGGNDPAACGACSAGEAWYGGEPTVPAPSDEAVEAATAAVKANREYAVSIPGERYLFVAPEDQAYDTLAAAMPFMWAEAQAARTAEIVALRKELENQWWENHFEHCGRTWPHHPGDDCHWPRPSVLDAHFNPEAE